LADFKIQTTPQTYLQDTLNVMAAHSQQSVCLSAVCLHGFWVSDSHW